jgi:serine-type D-Ala-D-Ala carboxypeptidase (penicillin-binding protein 5/6)
VLDPGGFRSDLGGPQLASTDVGQGPGTPPLPPPGTAASWLVVDLNSGVVLAAKDAHGRYPPASVLKILTALTLIPRLAGAAPHLATAADVNVDGSRVGIEAGVTYSIEDLFTALLSVSGNDAAQALANAAGGVAPTVAAMNAQARTLHADDTIARNPSGLDAPEQVSSVYDLALLARAGLAIPDFARYVSTATATFPARDGTRFHIDNHNLLLSRYPGAIGVKNGFTTAANASLVAAARRGNAAVLVSLLDANANLWSQATALLDWGFAALGQGPGIGILVGPRATDTGPAARAQSESVRPAAAQPAAGDPAATTAAAPGGGGHPAQFGWAAAAIALLAAAGCIAGVRRRRRLPEH